MLFRTREKTAAGLAATMPAMLKARSALLGAAALAAMAFAPAVMAPAMDVAPGARAASATKAAPKHGNTTPASPEQRAAWLRVRGSFHGRRTWPGRGWTVAHDRRMARKRRAVVKARRASRG